LALPEISLKTNPSTPVTIAEDCFCGYHRFCLEQPYHLDYVSSDLCNMLGYTPDEIHNLFHDKYSQIVCEKDREKFLHYIGELASREQTLTLQYHMVCKNGKIIYLHDTTTSRHLEDGQMYGFAVVADITDMQRTQVSDSRSLSSRLIGSCGLLKFTCEKYPKITQINQKMKDYLKITDQTSNWYDLLRENIYFMIPFDERDTFQNDLEKALQTGTPVRIRHRLLCSNNSHLTLTGWLSVSENELGEKAYSLICVPAENESTEIQSIQKNTYFKVLENAYNVIFEINISDQIVECIGGRSAASIGSLYDAHMTLESAKKFWLNHYIVEEDRDIMANYFDQIANPQAWNDTHIYRSKFRLKWTDNVIHSLIGVAVLLDKSTVLLCCQDLMNIQYSLIPDTEQAILDKLHSWIEYKITHEKNALGLVLIETSNQTHSLVFASQSIADYLGVEKDEYLRYLSGDHSIQELLDFVGLSLKEFQGLLKSGHLTFFLKPDRNPEPRQITLTCTPYHHEKSSLYEIWVYNDPFHTAPEAAPKKIFARTFGHFDLFVDDVPISFSSEKEKELMALLIDRNGGTLSPGEAISYLWEDTELNGKVSARYRKLAMGLKNTLDKHGIGHILLNDHGVRSINVSALKCDYYELLAGNPKYQNAFHNSYMTNYSWAEETLATLWCSES
jgi:PAS domain S-box-containing protein